MIQVRGFAGCLAAAMILASCAHTSMTSIPSPELGTRTFKSILVIGDFADLGIRRDFEERFVGSNQADHFRFVPSYQVLFPGRQYSQNEMVSILRARSIDATLVVSPGGTGASTTYVPPTYTSGCTVWTSSGGCQQVTTTTSGDYTYSKPWAQFTAQLYDANSGQVVWYATATTGGNAYATNTTLVRSMADKTVERMAADHVIH